MQLKGFCIIPILRWIQPKFKEKVAAGDARPPLFWLQQP
jgi:hypothetical protein